MIIQDVIDYLEELAPLHYAEDFDNVGLLVGNKNEKLKGILVTLDTLETVIDEAIENNCNLIVSFHPILFKGLKKITGTNYVEKTILKAIQNNIAIYAIHTALDNVPEGVNNSICEALKLQNRQLLLPKNNTLKKLTTYVPTQEAESLRNALFLAGAGHIGNYSHCSFNVNGTGTFMGNEISNPTKGEKNKMHFENETKITVIFEAHKEASVLQSLFKNHSYEEVAYEIITLNNKNQTKGMGMIGEFNKALNEKTFLTTLKKVFGTPVIKHSSLLNKPIKKIAVLGGSGSFAIQQAICAGADAFVTSDLKYHDYFSAENNILLVDIGHYESEQFTKNLLVSYLSKKITNFAVVLSKTITNPVKYF
ncbi:MAG TPA: Nif3-like dinuclear metal center hexameric protein [Flavobacteriaceae bacterium]|nr:Nif3-like dinuclear metal center hexameric protein [Flavobacteriaceae bacterium]